MFFFVNQTENTMAYSVFCISILFESILTAMTTVRSETLL